MTDTGLSDEPLQQLPQGLPRRYAEYKPAPAVPATPPSDVGGYDELLAHFRAAGKELPRSKEGLAAVDELWTATPTEPHWQSSSVTLACSTVTYSRTLFPGRTG